MQKVKNSLDGAQKARLPLISVNLTVHLVLLNAVMEENDFQKEMNWTPQCEIGTRY